MRIHHITILSATATLLMAGCTQHQSQLTNLNDSISWALGENIALSIQDSNMPDINSQLFLEAFQQTLDGKAHRFDDATYKQLLQSLIQQSRQPQHTPNATQPLSTQDIDAKQQDFFRQLVQTNPNVHQHPSGFYYEQLRAGSGPNATLAQRISFDYRSFDLFSGQPFDQTYGKRDPIIHVIGNPMFPGLIDGLQLMNAGSIYRFYFPYQLLFGTKGSGSVPGSKPLIYEIELHEIYND